MPPVVPPPMPAVMPTPSAGVPNAGLALEQAARAVLGDAWGCVPLAPAEAARLAAPCQGTALPLSIQGQPHQLHLLAEEGVVAVLLPRMLGRVAAAEEIDSLGDEMKAELLNQVGGRLAGWLGEQGAAVELGTPVALAAVPSALALAAVPSPVAAAAPSALEVTAWRCGGHGLLLSLLRTPSSHP